MKNIAVLESDFCIKKGLQFLLTKDEIRIRGMLNHFQALQLMLDDRYLDVIIMEIYDSKNSSIEGFNFIKKNKKSWENVRLIVLTELNSPILIKTLMNFQPSAIISKRDATSEIMMAFRHAAFDSGTYCSPAVIKMIKSSSHQALTCREFQLLILMMRGRSPQEIASELNISYKTVYTHKYNVMKKTGARNLVGLMQLLTENKLIA